MAFNNANEHQNNMRIEKEKEICIPIIKFFEMFISLGKTVSNEKGLCCDGVNEMESLMHF